MVEQVRNESVAVGTTPVQVAPELYEGQRKVLNLVNTSTAGQVISITVGQEAGAGVGIVLYPQGGWSEAVDGGFIPTNRFYRAVSSAVGGTLAVHERIEVR